MTQLKLIGKNSQKAKYELSKLKSNKKNNILNKIADELVKNTNTIIKENKLDIIKAKQSGVKESLIDRLLLTEDRIISMAEGLNKISRLMDPVGEVLYMKEMGNGLKIGKKRVPMGVIVIIFESRPNVTIDAFGLCFKTNNVVILRGGSDAINSNKILVEIVQHTLEKYNLPKEIVQIIKDTDRKN